MEGRNESGSRLTWLMWGVVAVVIYVLSIGPVVKFRLLPNPVAKVVYAPVALACGVPAIDRLIDWYVYYLWQADRTWVSGGLVY